MELEKYINTSYMAECPCCKTKWYCIDFSYNPINLFFFNRQGISYRIPEKKIEEIINNHKTEIIVILICKCGYHIREWEIDNVNYGQEWTEFKDYLSKLKSHCPICNTKYNEDDKICESCGEPKIIDEV